jgi:hypothetical protein
MGGVRIGLSPFRAYQYLVAIKFGRFTLERVNVFDHMAGGRTGQHSSAVMTIMES